MDEIRRVERWNRTFRLTRQNSEDSTLPEEDISNTLSSVSNEDRNAYYARQYPRLAKLEEVCRQIEEEKELKFNKSIQVRKKLFSISESTSSETLISDSSTVAASDSGYDAEDSMSVTMQTMINLLDHSINDSVADSSAHAGSLQDSLLHESSLSSTQTSYMELKLILREISTPKQKYEILSDTDKLSQLKNQLIRIFDQVPKDFQDKLKTILEETEEHSDLSADTFKSLLLEAIYQTQSIRDEMATYSIHSFSSSSKNSVDSSKPSSTRSIAFFNSTGSSKVIKSPVNVKLAKTLTLTGSPLLYPDSAKSTELENGNLSELSFTEVEKICMGAERPKTPKPMPALTEEQKKALERCRKQELELLSESPYSSKSYGSQSSKIDADSRKARSLVCSAVRGSVLSSFASLSDWDIGKAVQRADRKQRWIDFSAKKDAEDKMHNSYADEFMYSLRKHFTESNGSKSPSGLDESSVENAPIRKTQSFKASKLANSSAMATKKRDGSKRKITSGFIKKKSLIPRYIPETSKSATMSKAKVSCIRDMIHSAIEEKSRTLNPQVADGKNYAVTWPDWGDKSAAPSLLDSDWTDRSGKSASQSSGLFNLGLPIPMINVVCSTPEHRVIHESSKSPEIVSFGKFEKRYFCTPGKTPPVPKKRRIFFPTPEKRNTPKVNANSSIKAKIPVKAKSPVEAYIRGDLSASLIKSTRRVISEFLHK